jgi:hypothetical protein
MVYGIGFTTLDRFVWESCTPKPNGWSFSRLSMASFLEVYGTPMYTPFPTTPHYQIVHHPIRSHSLPWNAMNIPLKIKDRMNIQIPSYYETMPLFQNIHRLIKRWICHSLPLWFSKHTQMKSEFLISEGTALHSTSDSVGWGDTSAVDHLDIDDIFGGYRGLSNQESYGDTMGYTS